MEHLPHRVPVQGVVPVRLPESLLHTEVVHPLPEHRHLEAYRMGAEPIVGQGES